MKITKARFSIFFICLVLLIALGASVYFASLLFRNYCGPSIPARGLSSYSPVIDPAKIDQGYLLLAPVETIPNASPSGGMVYLTDLFGKTLHTWTITSKPWYAELDASGNLIVLLANMFPGDLNAGEIQKFDWGGKLIWDYQNSALHHDFTLLPNGHIVAIASEPIPLDLVQRIKGGMPVDRSIVMNSDQLIELDQDGKIVWSWHENDHLDPTIDEIDSFNPRDEWAHTNSIQYIKSNPFDGEEGFLISMRQTSTVIMIRKRDGVIIWRSPGGLLASQHDATLLPNGNILIFNNRTNGYGSQVVELNPKTNKMVWDFQNGITGFEQIKFHSPYIGGAQRLKNGDTMVIDGYNGHLFEITPQKKLVWDFVNPFGSPRGYNNALWPANAVFKARRYYEDEINWPEKLPQPLPTTTLQCQSIYNFFRLH